MHRSRPTSHFATGCQLTAVSLAFHYSLTPEADSSLLRCAFNVFREKDCRARSTLAPPQHRLYFYREAAGTRIVAPELGLGGGAPRLSR
jgi:hypothetical protein